MKEATINTKGLRARDIATIGIFGAVLFVLCVLSSAITGAFPVIYCYAPAIVGLISGPVFMLIVSKVHKTGAVILPCAIVGIIFLVMGAAVVCVAMLIAGAIGELIAAKSKYQNFKLLSLCYLLYIVAYYISTIGPMYYMVNSYQQTGKELFSAEYIESLLAVAHSPASYIAVPVMILAALLSAWAGKRLMKKHFVKAGIL